MPLLPEEQRQFDNFDAYPVENLQVPTLILHAKNDKMAKYSDTQKTVPRFPNCTFIAFETGGHLMVGHDEEIKKAVADFIKQRSNGMEVLEK